MFCICPDNTLLPSAVRVLAMRLACLVILLSGTLGAQTLVEYSGAAAGGTAGGVAGKKVSDGVTGIFNKLDKTTAKAAGTDTHGDKGKNAPVLDVGPGVPHSRAASAAGAESASAPKASAHAEAESVPPPPPATSSACVPPGA